MCFFFFFVFCFFFGEGKGKREIEKREKKEGGVSYDFVTRYVPTTTA